MLAQLGYEKLDDIIGQTNLLRPRDISLVKTQHLDLGYLLSVCGCIIYFFPVHISYSWHNFFFSYGIFFFIPECRVTKMEQYHDQEPRCSH